MIVEVRQIGKYNDRDKKAEYGEFTMLPMSSRSFVTRQQKNHKYLTGLQDDVETRERLEKVLGVKLDDTSDFWKTYRMTFRLPTGNMLLDLENPEHELFYIVAQANFLLAPDRDTLKEDQRFKTNTIFYVYDKEGIAKKEAQIQELNDEVSSLMYAARNNQQKLLFVAHALGLFVTDAFKADSLYVVLSKYKEKLKTPAQVESFRDTFKLPNDILQARYYVKKALEFKIVEFDPTSTSFKFQSKAVGRLEQEVFTYFSDKKNAADLASLIIEVQEQL